jgi:glyoxylase-like metal-dependent hydrolase (beta-lactamase superfamily II)
MKISRRVNPSPRCSAAGVALLLAAWLSPCAQAQAPIVQEDGVTAVVPNVYVIPDRRVNLVPNIGIVIGERGILVVDTGMGPANTERVLRAVRKVSDKRILFLTVTHFHPEHGMGAQAFPAETILIYPKSQKEELAEKSQSIIQMFNGFSPEIAALLKDVHIVSPQVVFPAEAELDLGGLPVQLLQVGPAHTRGDEVVFLTAQKILFCGDLVVNRFFPIMPDPDSSGSHWIVILDRLAKMSPAIVVPGHGAVGDARLIAAMKEYLVYLRGRVRELHGQGKSLAEIESVLGPEVRSRYKDWDNPEWIKPAVDNFFTELKAK